MTQTILNKTSKSFRGFLFGIFEKTSSMKLETSVNKAIVKAQLMVNVPVAIAMFGIPGLAMYLSVQEIIPGWGIGLAAVIGFILGWGIWSYMIVKWKLWAFSNVKNVHELKRKAIEQKLIWPDRSIFNKTEIWSSSDKVKWQQIHEKFNTKDVCKEDYSIPRITEIYYSKSKNYFQMAIMLFVAAMGLFLLFMKDNYIFGGLLTAIGAYFSFSEFKQANNTEAQIYLDNKGVKTINVAFKGWSEIRNEHVVFERSGKYRKAYLKFDYSEGNEKLQIDDYNISKKKLEELLKTYRIRFEKNNS